MRYYLCLQLRIEGEGLRHVELSLEHLKTKFKRHSVSAAMQCSGNRRHGMSQVKKIQGLDWDIGSWPASMMFSTCIGLPETCHVLINKSARTALSLHVLFTWSMQIALASRLPVGEPIGGCQVTA